MSGIECSDALVRRCQECNVELEQGLDACPDCGEPFEDEAGDSSPLVHALACFDAEERDPGRVPTIALRAAAERLLRDVQAGYDELCDISEVERARMDPQEDLVVGLTVEHLWQAGTCLARCLDALRDNRRIAACREMSRVRREMSLIRALEDDLTSLLAS